MDDTAGARLATVNVFAADIDKVTQFYAELLGFKELSDRRTSIFRSLDAGGIQLGINGPAVYGLLGLSDRESKGRAPVRLSFTVDVARREDVDDAVARVDRLGGRVIKPAGATSYNAWQTVLEDPEGNVFRISHRM